MNLTDRIRPQLFEKLRRHRTFAFGLVLGAVLFTAPANDALADGETVKIGIHSKDNYGKAYLTWAPVKAWAQLASPGDADVHVKLTNDADSTQTHAGKPIDGNLAFSATQPAQGKTATQSELTLTLPKNGDPVAFYLAGEYPRASTKDGDAVVLILSAEGVQIDKRATMVRVRKEFKTLTDDQRTAFLKVLNNYQVSDSQANYLHTLAIHDWSARGKYPALPYPKYPGNNNYEYPDQAHKGPGFLAWHRAYLLEFERKLQKIDPSVAIPYWPSNQSGDKTKVFTKSGMGANLSTHPPTSPPEVVVPTFDDDHPFEDWRMPKAEDPSVFEPIQRYAGDPTTKFIPSTDEQIFGPIDENGFRLDSYGNFADSLEGNPHNRPGHNDTGPWMANCRVSPRDPVFWLFHSWFDKMWAEWQYKYNRFTRSDEDYSPLGKFNPDVERRPAKGHFIDDTIWPWNDVTGEQENEFASRPPVKLTGPFNASGVEGIWPGKDTTAVPTPGDTIDYAGTQPGNLNMGFAYDNVPYGAKSSESPKLLLAEVSKAQSVPGGDDDDDDEPKAGDSPQKFSSKLDDNTASLEARHQALASLNVRENDDHAEVAKKVASDAKSDHSLRSMALQRLADAGAPNTAKLAADILTGGEDDHENLDVHAVLTLSFVRMFHELNDEEHKVVRSALRGALNDERMAVKSAALHVLAVSKDETAVTALKSQLSGESERVLALSSTVHLLASAEGKESHEHIRPLLKHEDANARLAAVSHLGGDAESQSAIAAILRDPKQPYKVRSAAAGSLLYHDKNFGEIAFPLIEDDGTPERLKKRLVRALRKHASDLNPTKLSEERRKAILAKLDNIKG